MAVLVVASSLAVGGAPGASAATDELVDSVSFEPLDPGGLVGIKDRGLFHGSIVVRGSSSGLTFLNQVGFEDYLRGIAEMPASWPLEAQKAQVIAARSYLLAERASGGYSGYGADICATDACQVYQGADREPTTPLWQRAVRETEGQVLLYQGSPILARYHSTDGGHTKSNLEAYGHDVPYLQGVPDPDDAVSPLHHWVVTFSLADLEASLRSRAETAPPSGRLVQVARSPGGPLMVTTEEPGRPQAQATLDPVRVMVRLNNDAPDRFPDRYPGPTESGNGFLPLTVPDEDYTARTEGDTVVIDGRGWGHKVGMSQYGAKGKAERGLGAADILAEYYSGLRPTRFPTPPEVRVLLGYGLESRTISSNAPFRVVDGAGRVIAASTLGGWKVVSEGDRVRVVPAQGLDTPLAVSAPVPVRASTVQAVPGAIRFSLTSPARVEATLEGGRGAARKLPVRVLDAGDRQLLLGDLFNKALPRPGSYKLRVVAIDTRGTRVETVADLQIVANARADIPTSDALFGVPVAVGAEADSPPAARLAPGAPSGRQFPVGYVLAVVVLLLVAVAVWRVRAWIERSDPLAPVAPPPTIRDRDRSGPGQAAG